MRRVPCGAGLDHHRRAGARRHQRAAEKQAAAVAHGRVGRDRIDELVRGHALAVSAASSACRLRACSRRRSAGTRSPLASLTTSPGTSGRHWDLLPPAIAQHGDVLGTHCASASIARPASIPGRSDQRVEQHDGENHHALATPSVGSTAIAMAPDAINTQISGLSICRQSSSTAPSPRARGSVLAPCRAGARRPRRCSGPPPSNRAVAARRRCRERTKRSDRRLHARPCMLRLTGLRQSRAHGWTRPTAAGSSSLSPGSSARAAASGESTRERTQRSARCAWEPPWADQLSRTERHAHARANAGQREPEQRGKTEHSASSAPACSRPGLAQRNS